MKTKKATKPAKKAVKRVVKTATKPTIFDIVTPKTYREFDKSVAKLDKQFGMGKVALIHEDGMGEGIWYTPANAESKKILDGNSYDEFAFVRLANQPLGWNDLTWGGLVKVRTKGPELRPEGRLEDQTDEIIRTDREQILKLRAEKP